MSDKTGIEWTRSDDGTAGATWNPVTGCDDVSPGCDHCYARTFAERWRGVSGHYFERGFDVVLRPDKLDQPLRWTRPRRIFVNSMSDLFHKDVPDEYIACAFTVMAKASRHTFQVLTKRHARMRALLSSPEFQVMCFAAATSRGWDLEGTPWPLPNVWLGVSAEDQHWADIRIPALLDTAAAVRFISAEPLLGPLDLGAWLGQMWKCRECSMIQGQHTGSAHCFGCGARNWPLPILALDWVIAGGESGPGARPCELEWLRSIREQCAYEMVPLFMKQLGSALGKELGAGPKGGDVGRWPENLRVREFPRLPEMTGAAS